MTMARARNSRRRSRNGSIRRKNMSDVAAISLAIAGAVLVPVAIVGTGIWYVLRKASQTRDQIVGDVQDAIDGLDSHDEIEQGRTSQGGTWSSRIWNTQNGGHDAPVWCYRFESTSPNVIAQSPSCILTFDQARAAIDDLVADVEAKLGISIPTMPQGGP